jgi:hypothetical protein
MEPVRIGLLAVGGWLVAAALIVGISWSAISVVRDSVVPQTQIADALPPPDESPTATPTSARPTTRPTVGTAKIVTGQGGRVTVRCTNGRPEFLNIAPMQGFTAKADDSGAEVQFRSSDHRTEIIATCSGLTVQTTVAEERSGDGGGGGGSGSGRGGGGSDN